MQPAMETRLRVNFLQNYLTTVKSQWNLFTSLDHSIWKQSLNFFFFQPITADTFRAEIEVVEHCECTYLTLWLALILTFKVLLLLTGAFLAWQTRRVYILSLNDTQHCVSCMFVVVLFCLVGSIVAFTTTMYPDVFYAVIGIFIIVATTSILLLLFVNKVSRNLNTPSISSWYRFRWLRHSCLTGVY